MIPGIIHGGDTGNVTDMSIRKHPATGQTVLQNWSFQSNNQNIPDIQPVITPEVNPCLIILFGWGSVTPQIIIKSRWPWMGKNSTLMNASWINLSGTRKFPYNQPTTIYPSPNQGVGPVTSCIPGVMGRLGPFLSIG